MKICDHSLVSFERCHLSRYTGKNRFSISVVLKDSKSRLL